jgi:diguanylate cyclase (GGDEF)-like protein/PAS domain S-box-containing protein
MLPDFRGGIPLVSPRCYQEESRRMQTLLGKLPRFGRAHIWLSGALLAVIAVRIALRYDALDRALHRDLGRGDAALEVALLPVTALLCALVLFTWRRRFLLDQEMRRRVEAEERLRHQHAYLAAMQETSTALANRADLDAMLAAIVRRAAALIGTAHGFVDLLMEDGSALRGAVGIGAFADNTDHIVPRGAGMSGAVWETGRPLIVDDYQTWPGGVYRERFGRFRAAIGVPLISGGHFHGVLGLAHDDPTRTVGEREAETLAQFAALAAIALDNARLIQAAEAGATQYRLLFESNPEPMWVCDRETLRFLAVNDAAIAHYGYSREEFLAMTTVDIRPEGEVERLRRTLAREMESEQSSGIWRHRKRDGTDIAVATTSYPIEFDGRPARIVLANDITERERALAALQESETRFRAQYQGNPVAIFTWQRTGDDYVFIDYNAAAAEMAGERIGALLGKTARDCYRAFPEVLEHMALADRERRGVQHEIAWTFSGTGEPADLLVTYVPAPPDLIMLYVEDITARKRAVGALRESEARYRQLIEFSPDAIFVHRDGAFLFANTAAVRLLGAASADAVIGSSIAAVVHPDDAAAARERVRAGYEEGRPVAPVEMRIVRADGRVVETEIASTPIVYEGEPATLSVLRDLSERKQAEERLRLLESVVVHSRDGVVITEAPTAEVLAAEGPRIVYVNEAFTRITGYTAEETIGRSPRFLQGEMTDQATLATLREAILREESLTVELVNYRKDGTPFWVEMSIAPVRDARGRCTHFVSVQRDITAWKQVQEQLIHDAMHDPLTGLANRTAFVARLEAALERARAGAERPFAVLFVDCDRFKNVNDSLGHVEGDRLLSTIARQLTLHLDPAWEVARLGGDEFAILAENIAGVDDAIRIAERVQAALAAPIRLRGQEVGVSASIGIALSNATYRQPQEMLRDADTAMYRAKASGRGRHVVFDRAMHERAVALLQRESDLRRAIERDEVQVLYQPITALEDGSVVGFEALLRWRHPELGLLAPTDFIAIAEETGQIIGLDRWVLRQACRQMRQWEQRFPHLPPLAMSVNVSGKHIAQPDFLEYVRTVLSLTGLDPARLRLEITESALIEHADAATATLWQARAMGIQVQLDDFGTGYSSLSYLHRFPIDVLKIDRSFISGGEPRIENTEIVRAIVTLARNLHIGVTAEGVETVEQVAQLRALGCTYGQGYYFSPPLDAPMAERLLTRRLPGPRSAAAS